MDEEKWYAKEFDNLREELKLRIMFLHKTINLAIVLLAVFLISVFVFIEIGISRELLHTYLLIIPFIMMLLGFNYQSNQNSLESIPKYCEEIIKPVLVAKYKNNILGWEKFFADQKYAFRIESVTKVFPFIIPALIPLYFIFTHTSLHTYQWVMVGFDLVLFLLMIENFRYKLRRVK